MVEVQSILDAIKGAKGIRSNVDLAPLLGVTPNTVSTWKIRKAIPRKSLAWFCKQEHIDIAILFERGEWVKDEGYMGATMMVERPPAYQIPANLCAGPPEGLRELVEAVVEIMTSEDETTKAALKMNVVAFRQAVNNTKEITNLKRDMEAIKKVLHPQDCSTDAKEG
jgi:hypothetical protein